MKYLLKNKCAGFTLVEVVLGTAIVLLVLVSLVAAYSLYLRVAFSNLHKTQAIFLSEEGIEAVKLMRDDSFDVRISPLNVGTNYFLSFSNGKWGTTTTNGMISGNFLRHFTVESVMRDSQSNIVSSGGTIDPDTKKITVFVEWREQNSTTTKAVSTYITNLFDN
jgi:type II secretory pathway pseudopilin PulG